MYQHGIGTRKRPREAFKWITMAAGQDDELRQYMLAEMYANGEGTTQDYDRAAEEYQKAVDGDVTSAFHALGNLYLYGSPRHHKVSMRPYQLPNSLFPPMFM
jgi:TPR repeat protein